MLNSQFPILIGWELRIEHWSDLWLPSHPPQSDPSIVRVQLDQRPAGADVEIEIALVDASSDGYWKVRVDAASIGPRFDVGRE